MEELTHIVNAQATQLERVSSKMNEMIKEMNEMREKVDKLNRPTAPIPAAEPDKDGDVQTKFKPPQTDEKKSHARTGAYKPEDVSVDKFFYSGTGGPKE